MEHGWRIMDLFCTLQLPAYTAASKASPLGWDDALIAALVLLSIAGESVADNQQWGTLGILSPQHGEIH